ncbi:MAG: hypothetical protein ACE5GS_15005 [Kiloniellaceae bacterium]
MALLAALGGCALGARAEAVYLQQHKASGALAETILAVETDQPALAEELYGLEDELGAACAPLREAGHRRWFGQEVDGDLEWAVVRALDTCEAKAREVERLVRWASPEAAGYSLAGPEHPAAGADE